MRATKIKDALRTSRLPARRASVLAGEGTILVATYACLNLLCSRETLVFRRPTETIGVTFCEACDYVLVLRGEYEAEYEINVAAGVMRYRRTGATASPWVYAPVPLGQIAPA